MSPQLSAVTLNIDPALRKDPRLPDTGDLVAGRYRVRSLLGSGGMSAVYVAEDESLGRAVALKVMYPKFRSCDDVVARFMNEACTLAQVRSRHVVTIYDSGFTACDGAVDLPFMTLELLHGTDLWTLMHERSWPEPRRAVRYLIDACEGLAAAHALGIVHRDLKPENLFVVRDADGSDYVKVFDFGIAKAPKLKGRRQLTRYGESMGSPHYMSPEQLQMPQELDCRSDVWALGAVLYELLTTRAPFDGATPLEICSHILSKRPTSAGDLRPELPLPLVGIVERCLTRNRDARYSDVAELAEALLPFAEPGEEAGRGRVQRLQHLLGRGQEEPLLLRRRRNSSPPDATPSMPPPARRRSSDNATRVRRWLAMAIANPSI